MAGGLRPPILCDHTLMTNITFNMKMNLCFTTTCHERPKLLELMGSRK